MVSIQVQGEVMRRTKRKESSRFFSSFPSPPSILLHHLLFFPGKFDYQLISEALLILERSQQCPIFPHCLRGTRRWSFPSPFSLCIYTSLPLLVLLLLGYLFCLPPIDNFLQRNFLMYCLSFSIKVKGGVVWSDARDDRSSWWAVTSFGPLRKRLGTLNSR